MEVRVKELLRRDGIKLWLPPYTVAGRQCGSYPMDMLVKYAREAGRSAAEMEDCLEKIRKHAVARLQANNKYAETGTATLYVSKVVVAPDGNGQGNSSGTSEEDQQNKGPTTVECKLSILGSELRTIVAGDFSVPEDSFRMIAQAHVIEDNRILNSQGIEHGMDILCIMLTKEERETLSEQCWRSSADQTRDAVKRLMESNEFTYLQIVDQHGKSVRLPDEENTALTVAMALHEKGRKALKRRQYGQALLYFLESDKEFDLCSSDILRLVDNYAILCLDIVWCYLRLQRVNSLPDAERRLRLADVGFRRSYGPNFERLAKIRRGVMHEKALIIRLKLLQGALSYYQRRYRQAHEYLVSVSKEIKALEVDDAKLSQVVAMGYSTAEARLGLRASDGNIEGAVYQIIEERENEARREKERAKKQREKQLHKRFGKTPSGKHIDLDTYEKIVEMGYSKRAAGRALCQANNDMNAALELLRLLPQIQAPGDDMVEAVEDALFERNGEYSEEEIVSQLASFGFPAETVSECLRLHPNDLIGAVEALLTSEGPFRTIMQANPEFRNEVMRIAHELQGHQQQHGQQTNRNTSQQQSLEQAAFNQLQGDVSNSLHDHLDTTFEEELQVLEMLQPLVMAHLK